MSTVETHRLMMAARRRKHRADPAPIVGGLQSTDEDWPADSDSRTFWRCFPALVVVVAAAALVVLFLSLHKLNKITRTSVSYMLMAK